jgi:hypothetical protein
MLLPENAATRSWWKDWDGECCALVASGASLQKDKLHLLRDRMHVAVIKENYDLCPWAEIVYGCDVHWWRHRRGLPDYKGLKLAYDKNAAFCGIQLIGITDPKDDKLSFDVPGVVGSGGNSGFQLFNLVQQFGCTGIMLLGFDMGGEHWYGRNRWDHANNPDNANFKRWAKAFDSNAAAVDSRGVDVVNTSRTSRIKAFRISTIEETIEWWGL